MQIHHIVERHLLGEAHGEHSLAGVVKEVAHGHTVVYVADSLREHRGGGQYLYLVVALYGGAIYGIGGYQQLYGALLDLLYALSRSTTWDRNA